MVSPQIPALPDRAIDEGLNAVDPILRTEAIRLDGDPARKLISRCEEGVDLLILGSRGYGPLARVLLGSVSRKVAEVKAFQLTAWQTPPELREVPVTEQGPGQVLVKVGGAGACHSDLHLMEWPPGTLDLDPPFTLGHEIAGWVEDVGAGVEGLELGEAVAVYGPWRCGRCRSCRLSAENYCARQALAAEQIRDLTGGRGAELVLDMVGSEDSLALAAAVAKFESQVTMVGRIRAHTEGFSLADAADAHARMRAGTLAGRAVICPHG